MPSDVPVPPHSTTPVPTESLDAQTLGVSLTVRDLQTSLVWYRDVVGFTVDQEYHREGTRIAIALRAGAIRLLIGQDNGAKGTDRIKGEGFSMQLTTTQHIDALASRIKARGGTLEMEPTDMRGIRAFRLRDPDGFRFTISSPRED